MLGCRLGLGPFHGNASFRAWPAGEQLRSDTANRTLLRTVYLSEIGVREATGNNDGPRIEEYLRYCGLGPSHAWCAAFVSWCFGQAGHTQPRSPWSPSLLPDSKLVWRQGDRKPTTGASADGEVRGMHASTPAMPMQGDVFGIYYTNLERIGHVGFIDTWDGDWCITVEGNTGPGRMPGAEASAANPIRAGPAGEGVHRKRRPVRTIRAVARWTAP